jgi:glycosyltransferase involved in cell wall biosynthesis
MATAPLVSIVTPSFNQAAYIQEAMRSVLEQDYAAFEYIVIDGGSSDGSAELVKQQAGRLAYWVSEPDKGQADAINKGFARAKGKYFAWLNADDRLLPGAVSAAVAYLEANPDVGLVYGDTDFIDAQGSVIGRFAARQTDYRRMLQGYVHIPQQATVWRAALWQPLDAGLQFAMDYDLWVRVAKTSRVQYVPQLWAQFRLHADSKTMQNDMRAWEDMLKVHAREGGGYFSVMRFKYWLRKLLFPLLRARRQRMANAGTHG